MKNKWILFLGLMIAMASATTLTRCGSGIGDSIEGAANAAKF